MALLEDRRKIKLHKEKPQTGTQGGARGAKRDPKDTPERKKELPNEKNEKIMTRSLFIWFLRGQMDMHVFRVF